MIHNPQHYARDFYFFKRAQYPQLSLVHKKPAQAFLDLQRQCFLYKFAEIGKVMLTWGILKVAWHFNPGIFNPKNFQPQAPNRDFSDPHFSAMNSSTMKFLKLRDSEKATKSPNFFDVTTQFQIWSGYYFKIFGLLRISELYLQTFQLGTLQAWPFWPWISSPQ